MPSHTDHSHTPRNEVIVRSNKRPNPSERGGGGREWGGGGEEQGRIQEGFRGTPPGFHKCTTGSHMHVHNTCSSISYSVLTYCNCVPTGPGRPVGS